MDNGTYSKIREAISKNNTIGIVVGKNHTVDEMGAALALYLTLLQDNKQVTIASPTEPLVEVSSLVGVDKVVTNLGGYGGDLVVSFPFKEKPNEKGEMESEIQKVSYTIENGFLNIVVKAGDNGLSFDTRDVQYKKGGAYPTLLFVIGSPRLSDLGTLFNPTELKDTMVVNIDNKPDNQGYGDIAFVSPKYSSVSEQVGDFLMSAGFPMDTDVSQNLLLGISFGTENFQRPNTTPLAFELVSFFLKKGASRSSNRQQPARANVNRQTQFPQPNVMDDFEQLQNPADIESKEKDDKTPPPTDWLSPKVYRGGGSGTNLS